MKISKSSCMGVVLYLVLTTAAIATEASGSDEMVEHLIKLVFTEATLG